jgi:hypothetical protein
MNKIYKTKQQQKSSGFFSFCAYYRFYFIFARILANYFPISILKKREREQTFLK